MKHALRKTPSPLQLAYKYGEPGGDLLARNLVLEVEGNLLTVDVDLSANLLTRNKNSSWYQDAVQLAANYHKLKFVQCHDNLVRSRLIRLWESIENPRLRVRLVLDPKGRYLYEVAPHSLFMGGIQLDVQGFLEDESETEAGPTAAGEDAPATTHGDNA